MKEINKSLLNNTELTVENKGRIMRDFVLDLNKQYRRKVYLLISRMRSNKKLFNLKPNVFANSSQ
jgi:hypothetical protein